MLVIAAMGLDLWAIFSFYKAMLRFPLFKLLCVWLLISSLAMGLVVQSLDPEIHNWDRSQDIDTGRTGGKQFIGYNFDWSGVGRSSDGKWATMIGPNHFLSANHFRPGIGATVTFSVRNFADGSVTVHSSSTVVDGIRIGSTDLWIGKIDTKPVGVTWYDIFTSTNFADYDLVGDNGVLNGQPARLDTNPDDVTDILFMVGRNGGNNTTSTFRVGLNASGSQVTLGGYKTDRNFDFDGVGGNPPQPIGISSAMPYNIDSQDTTVFTGYEAYVVSGDSGGPTFYAPTTNMETIAGTGTPSTLQLYGIHAGNNSGGTPVLNSFSVDTLPGEYLTEINAFMIPEPAHFAVLFGALALLVTLRKRGRPRNLNVGNEWIFAPYSDVRQTVPRRK